MSDFIRGEVTEKRHFFGTTSSNSLYSVYIIVIKNLYIPFENLIVLDLQINSESSSYKNDKLDRF